MGVIPDRPFLWMPFLWMTERQRQELRLRASHIVADLAADLTRGSRVVGLSRGRRLLSKPRRPDALPVARLVRRCR